MKEIETLKVFDSKFKVPDNNCCCTYVILVPGVELRLHRCARVPLLCALKGDFFDGSDSSVHASSVITSLSLSLKHSHTLSRPLDSG